MSAQPSTEVAPEPQVVSWMKARGLSGQRGDHVSLCTQRPGGSFHAQVLPVEEAAQVVATRCTTGVNVWLSVNPMVPGTADKGGAGDVAALVALWADLDIGRGKLPSYKHAERITQELSGMLGTAPVSLTWSGHGAQPIWAVERTELSDKNRPEAAYLLQRWGALVRQVGASVAPGAKIDGVFNLDRILRVPGTQNMKVVTP